MTAKKHKKSRLRTPHFLIIFWLTTAILALLRGFVVAPQEKSEKEEVAEEKTHSIVAPATDPMHADLSETKAAVKALEVDQKELENLPDTIAEVHEIVQRIFRTPRAAVAFRPSDNKPLKSKTRKLNYSEVFNDLNDVQLNTAMLIGAPECEDRAEAAAHNERYVYVGASPYYDIEQLTHSVPYLVPQAAILLDEIGRAFMDSLTSKGVPFHKIVVTSLLRTNADVEQLTRHNRNATEQSCHKFGTTFDIAYKSFHRCYDPDGPKQQEWSARELMPILAEVLDDQHRLGTCYIKHETRKHCFHITVR